MLIIFRSSVRVARVSADDGAERIDEKMAVIERIIAKVARGEFARAMRFDGKNSTDLPSPAPGVKRLLYLHIPFCESLCPYCSFHRIPFEDALARAYFKAIRKELILYRDRGYDFAGIYVGGGTPTVLTDELVETLAEARRMFSIGEISVETNPSHLREDRIGLLVDGGVNRLSVGVQSFDDCLLADMGRLDRYGGGALAAERLKNLRGRFETVNADMMFNFPAQTEASIERDLAMLRDLELDQVTYYPLMVSDAARGQVQEMFGALDYEKERSFYLRITEGLTPLYRQATAWCFSRSAAMIDEYIVDYEEYAGLGSGSIGYLGGRCYANTFDIEGYIGEIRSGRLPIMAARGFTVKERMRYDFLMKLFGLSCPVSFFRDKYGLSLLRVLWQDVLAFYLAGGLRYKSGVLGLTLRGRYFWVIMMRQFFTAVNNFRDYCRRGIEV